MKKYLMVILFLVFISFIVSLYISNNNVGVSIEEAMKEIKYQKIYHIEKLNNEAIVFYKNNSVLSEGYLRKNSIGWKWIIGGGSLELESSKDLSWNYTANDKKLPVFFGIIRTPKIVNVKIKELETGNAEKSAKIIKLEDDLKLWFVSAEKLIEDLSFIIIGVTSEGEEIYYH